MIFLRRTSKLVALLAVALAGTAIAPVAARETPVCNWSKATALRAAADRDNAHKRFAQAAGRYAAAAQETRDCRTPRGSMLTARSLAQAGTALALKGDYLPALPLLHEAQSRLAYIEAHDRTAAPAAHAYSDLVENIVSAINRVAESSM